MPLVLLLLHFLLCGDHMEFLNKLFNRAPAAPAAEPAPEGVTYELPINFPKKIAVPLSPRMAMLRPLKWVTYQGMVGIIAKVTEGGDVIVDLVNAEGVTVQSVTAPQGQDVQIAKWRDIPEPRRPADAAYAATLGYF